MVRTQRALSLRSIVLYGVLVVMFSLIMIPLACLVHNAFRHEARLHAHKPPAATA